VILAAGRTAGVQVRDGKDTLGDRRWAAAEHALPGAGRCRCPAQVIRTIRQSPSACWRRIGCAADSTLGCPGRCCTKLLEGLRLPEDGRASSDALSKSQGVMKLCQSVIKFGGRHLESEQCRMVLAPGSVQVSLRSLRHHLHIDAASAQARHLRDAVLAPHTTPEPRRPRSTAHTFQSG